MLDHEHKRLESRHAANEPARRAKASENSTWGATLPAVQFLVALIDNDQVIHSASREHLRHGWRWQVSALTGHKRSKMKDFGVIKSLALLLTLASYTAALWGLSNPINHHQQALRAVPFQQSVMDRLIPDILKPQTVAPKEDLSGQENGPIISDVLPKTKGINIFAQLTRDFEPIASRLNDPSKNITVLAPRNSAIQALPRKPWESPEDYSKFGEVDAYEGQEGQDRAKRNLQKFVEAHLVPASPWRNGEEVETVGGGKLRWEKKGDKIFVSSVASLQIDKSTIANWYQIQPGNIEVDSIAEKVSNGEVWVLNGVINYR